jgi:hypothetical protein
MRQVRSNLFHYMDIRHIIRFLKLLLVLIWISFPVVSQNSFRGDVPEGKSLEEFAENRLILTYETIRTGKFPLFIITGTPLNKEKDYTRIWLRRNFANNKTETDYTTNLKNRDALLGYEDWYIGRIDSQDSIYYLRENPVKGGYLFVCKGKHQENLFFYKGGVPEFLPGIKFFISPTKDKLYIFRSDHTIYLYHIELGILKQLNYLPRGVKPDFYAFPERDRLR